LPQQRNEATHVSVAAEHVKEENLHETRHQYAQEKDDS